MARQSTLNYGIQIEFQMLSCASGCWLDAVCRGLVLLYAQYHPFDGFTTRETKEYVDKHPSLKIQLNFDIHGKTKYQV